MILYRILMALLFPFVLARCLWRGERRADLAERLGLGATGPTGLWLHGASNGEITSARWLVQDIRAARPDLPILITANTLTARQMVQGWAMPGVRAQLAPLDLMPIARAFLTRQTPKALISLEAEFWPTRLAACSAQGIPVLALGARMSERSFKRWHLAQGFAARALGQLRLASTQDDLSRQHLLALGLRAEAVTGDFDLKAEAITRLPKPDLPPRAARADCLLAASTHPGEEEVILKAFAGSRFARLILAPRHPVRGDQIAALLAAQGLAFARRSTGGAPADAPIYLADTMGEMDLWYASAGATVIGGTFARKGGHTPWEPARFASALLHGPSTRNFLVPFRRLDAAGGALAVTPETLQAALQGLDGARQDQMALSATQVLQANGDAGAFLQAILTAARL